MFQEGEPGRGTQVRWARKVLSQGGHQEATGRVRSCGRGQIGSGA